MHIVNSDTGIRIYTRNIYIKNMGESVFYKIKLQRLGMLFLCLMGLLTTSSSFCKWDVRLGKAPGFCEAARQMQRRCVRAHDGHIREHISDTAGNSVLFPDVLKVGEVPVDTEGVHNPLWFIKGAVVKHKGVWRSKGVRGLSDEPSFGIQELRDDLWFLFLRANQEKHCHQTSDLVIQEGCALDFNEIHLLRGITARAGLVAAR